ncbi:MAG TPA: MaoC family dehydratase N-terminal domain-containing protein [Mycobacterium sp.]|nr:MaoC family dehydratase N-terminal domain-containing protein [Mycobacterium sp.]
MATQMESADGIIGTHYRYPDYFEVGRQKVREFADAVHDSHPTHFTEAAAHAAGYDAVVAPLTFLAVAGRRVQLEIFTQFDIPINIARVFHRDQKFKYHRALVDGDKLFFDTYLDSVLESHGTVIAEIRTEVTSADGEPLITSVVTMIGESSRQDAGAESAVAAIAAMRQ